MSVTIVSTLRTQAPASGTESQAGKAVESDNATIGQDFASLLLSQLAPIVPNSPGTTGVQAELPEVETIPAIDDAAGALLAQLPALAPDVLAKSAVQTDQPEEDTAPVDTASLVAAQGLVQQEPRRIDGSATPAAVTGAVQNDQRTPSALVLPLTTPAVTPIIKQDSKAEPVSTEPKLATTPATDDKPAKFAVPVLLEASKETAIPKAVSSDAPANTISALTSSTPANSNSALFGREPALPVQTPIRDQNWASDFGQKIVWLAGNDKHMAQLTLNPPQMGPIDISLNVEKGNATATFVSANADVREAIETAMPRLREMFASAGINLGQTNVSAESFKQQSGGSDGNRAGSSWMTDNAILVADGAGPLPSRSFFAQRGSGMVDIFA